MSQDRLVTIGSILMAPMDRMYNLTVDSLQFNSQQSTIQQLTVYNTRVNGLQFDSRQSNNNINSPQSKIQQSEI